MLDWKAKSSNGQLATCAGSLASIIWGMAVGTSGYLSTVFGAYLACGLECLVASLVLFLLAAYQGKLIAIFSQKPRYYCWCGLCWFANVALFWIAVGLIKVPNDLLVIGTLNYLWPTFTLIGTILILGKRSSILILPGVLFAMTGVIFAKLAVSETVILNPQSLSSSIQSLAYMFSDNPQAYLCAFFCAVAWALYSNFTRKWIGAAETGSVPLFMLGTGIAFTYLGLEYNSAQKFASYDLFILVLWSITTALAYHFWDLGMRKGNIVLLSSISMLIPLLSSIITCFVTDTPFTPALLLSSILLISGSILCKRSIRLSST
jgi:drug/metabolite transporter (DMT)-like permease